MIRSAESIARQFKNVGNKSAKAAAAALESGSPSNGVPTEDAPKQILTMRTKNIYLQNDPALVSMYERKIGTRELLYWLRSNPKLLPRHLA
mmetsp:Transcript_8220/g.11385  ORF Transcript_8220/g.11385 Transcript_8220/m.11385 type:complete len:91 (+) Transcript_8220:1168-1440(+)